MASTRQRGPIGTGALEDIVDGTLCRTKFTQPGTVGIRPLALSPLVAPYQFVYCEVWSDSQRRAFWRGFQGRVEAFVEEGEQILAWLQDAFGLGDEEGDFETAWKAFGGGFNQLAQLAWKVTVVIGVPLPLILHPKRDEYRKEIADLGLAITKEVAHVYKKAFASGGLPECSGVLLADILRLALEIAGAKGVGKLASTAKLAKHLPQKLKSAVPKLKKQPLIPDAKVLFATAKRVKLDPGGRPIALYFGIKDANKIPPRFATIGRMLGDTKEGQRLLKQLNELPWKDTGRIPGSEKIWWELSNRVAKKAGRGGPVHVYVSKAYYDRFFPDPATLKNWWRDHKDELIAKRQKELKAKNTPPDKLSKELTAHENKLDSWSQEDIEAQYYAVQGKNRFSGHFEDEIFHKVEALNLKDVHFHAVDDAGGELKTWYYRLLPD